MRQPLTRAKIKEETEMLHRAKDLSSDQRLAIEALLGRAISDEEAISIRAVVPPTIIPSHFSQAERAEALRQLDRYFAKVDAGRRPVSDEEEEAIFLEAIRSVRPNYRPV